MGCKLNTTSYYFCKKYYRKTFYFNRGKYLYLPPIRSEPIKIYLISLGTERECQEKDVIEWESVNIYSNMF